MVLLHYIILLNCIIIYLSLCLISKLFTLGNMIFTPASRRNYLSKKISDIRQKGMEYLLVIVYYLILLHYHYLFSIVFIILFLSSFTIFYYFFTFTFRILVDLAPHLLFYMLFVLLYLFPFFLLFFALHLMSPKCNVKTSSFIVFPLSIYIFQYSSIARKRQISKRRK